MVVQKVFEEAQGVWPSCLGKKETSISGSCDYGHDILCFQSVIDYGGVVYGLQGQALRLCYGAVKSTPIPALHVLAGEMLLDIKRKQLMVNYWANLKGHKEQHPTKAVLQQCWEQCRGQRSSFGWAGKIRICGGYEG